MSVAANKDGEAELNPDQDAILTGDWCWITVDGLSVRVARYRYPSSSRVVVAIYQLGKEDEESLAKCEAEDPAK